MTRKTLALLLAAPVAALALDGISFEHGDWQLVCDNTGTCRAAGGKDGAQDAKGGNGPGTAVLLTRQAGANAAVTAEIAIYTPEGQNTPQSLTLYHEHGKEKVQAAGKVALQAGEDDLTTGTLDAAQTQTLLTALRGKDDRVTLSDSSSDAIWTISGEGAAAVLLKMDDFQQRVGTPSALIQPGKENKAVLEAQAKPVIHPAPVASGEPQTLKINDAAHAALWQKLVVQGKTSCAQQDAAAKADITLYPLNDAHRLAAIDCDGEIAAPYGTRKLFAVVSPDLKTVEALPGNPDWNDGYENGVIYATDPGSMAACKEEQRYIWDGNAFQRFYEASTGTCKAFTVGFWEMPIFVSELKQ
jgi:raw score 12.19